MNKQQFLASLLGIGLGACGGSTASSPNKTMGDLDDTHDLAWVLRLDPQQGELPEGLALAPGGDTAFVGLALTGQILAVDLETGDSQAFGSIPAPPPNGG